MEVKEASWIIKQAKDADLVLDDDLKAEVIEKMSGQKRTKKEATKGKLKGQDNEEKDFDPLDDPFSEVNMTEKSDSGKKRLDKLE